MRHGHFDAERRDHVIRPPDTPLARSEDLGAADTFRAVSNSGGLPFHGARLQGFTRFRDNAPTDGVRRVAVEVTPQ